MTKAQHQELGRRIIEITHDERDAADAAWRTLAREIKAAIGRGDVPGDEAVRIAREARERYAAALERIPLVPRDAVADLAGATLAYRAAMRRALSSALGHARSAIGKWGSAA